MSELQALRDRVAELEELLGVGLPPVPPREIHFTATELRTCGLLLKHSVVTREFYWRALYGALPDCDQPQGDSHFSVYICKLRHKLRPKGIEIGNSWGVGYFMTPENKARLTAVLEDRA